MATAPARVLVVDQDLDLARELAADLRASGYESESSGGGARLARLLRQQEFSVAISNPEVAGLDVFHSGSDAAVPPAVILLADFGSVDEAVGAMRAGAFDYICKPASYEQIQVSVARAIEGRALRVENRRLKADLAGRYDLGKILSRDPALQRVFQTVEALADTRATILIEGETGTGKTLLARTIHERSSRAAGPFVEVNCGALPSSLLESELFGHARGAFTGAVRDKPGKFEAADGGTLFLDEVATAPHELQVKLLRVLQDRTFERVGETRTREADVRVITATNQDLAREVAAGRFREDLYYRIHVVALRLPPLRERPGDALLLAEHFLARFAAEHGRPGRRLAPGAIARIAAHTWPGNVRELEHCLERAVLLGRSSEVEADDLGAGLARAVPLPPGTRAAGSEVETCALPPTLVPLRDGVPLRTALEEPEREIIRRALERNGGNRKATAEMLDVNRTTLFNKMRKYRLMEFPIRAQS